MQHKHSVRVTMNFLKLKQRNIVYREAKAIINFTTLFIYPVTFSSFTLSFIAKASTSFL